ncbi:LysR family transcriptional regulator [Rhodobacteraceae bacterium MYP1-1]|uniref:LysR family transcriptional regulator n=2 Tax=Halocynthiibacter styelae TaxID=2761955 RepID=A0A8J7LKJ9_9RHOB|nr:LysR family transcriptional regulator [Paenihalocynthiibacter styelae]
MFIVIADTQSVSEAARRLNVSQPTASYALEKLRRGFNDPLLIRSGGKMNLTETGKALASTATSSLEEFNRITRQANFDPLTSDRTFKIMGATSELTGPYAGLPGKFRNRAPGAAFSYVTYDRTNCHERLHEDVDIFVGTNLPDAPSIERHVLREYPVGIYYDASVRSAPETIEDFVNAEFVTYNDRHSIVGNVDKALREMNYPPRTFRFVVNDFSSYPDLITGTDLLVTASLALRDSIFSRFAIAPIPEPLKVKPIPHYIGWSKRKSNMPCLRWMVDLFLECNKINQDIASPAPQ